MTPTIQDVPGWTLRLRPYLERAGRGD
jgi:hypothetical protein